MDYYCGFPINMTRGIPVSKPYVNVRHYELDNLKDMNEFKKGFQEVKKM